MSVGAESLSTSAGPSSSMAPAASSSPAARRPSTTGTPAERSSSLASCSASGDPAVRAASRRPRRCARRRAGSAGGRAQRRGADQAGAQPGDGGYAGVGEARGRRRRRAARGGWRPPSRAPGSRRRRRGCPRARRPRLRGRAVDSDGLVVEHHHLIDRGVLGHGGHDVAQGVHLAPDQRGVVERVADRGGVGQQLAEPRRRWPAPAAGGRGRCARSSRPPGRSRRRSR